ncbi:MAG TPA: MBL fold metallo-hydrolase [Thermoanaerobaculia bacterium]|nr:MBL fold metallo-hydrolase [Thermoanaerobaculia bacterium]
MSSERVLIQTEHLTIEGRSRAGHETWFRVRELGIALDIGRCPDEIIAVPNVFITHAHLDHAAGIPFYAAQRRLQRLEAGRIWLPKEAAADLHELMRIHERMEGTDYDIEIIGMAPGDSARVDRRHAVRAHAATHRVPARAWEFLELRHHLKPEFAGLDGAALAARRKAGEAVHDEVEYPILFYTGDTDRGILEQNTAIFQAEVLMIECSFLGDQHQDRAAMYRHIHFDDIAEFASRFENQLIVLTHFSRRYSRQEIRDTVRRRCPKSLVERIRVAIPE